MWAVVEVMLCGDEKMGVFKEKPPITDVVLN